MHKIISWNVNGIRAIQKKGFLDFLKKETPLVLGVQEIKAYANQLDAELRNPFGYKSHFFSAEKAGYSGVGLFVNKDLKYEIIEGLGVKKFDIEGRNISIITDDFVFVNCYFPNSQAEGKRLSYKVEYGDAIIDFLKKFKDKNILISGDYNIAHTEIDLTNPKDNEYSPGYFLEERSWMTKFLGLGFLDTFRLFNKEPNNYTWWSYRTQARLRNVGWRIDCNCVNQNFKDKILKSYHYTDVLGSDHCPVCLEFKV